MLSASNFIHIVGSTNNDLSMLDLEVNYELTVKQFIPSCMLHLEQTYQLVLIPVLIR